MAKTWTTLFTSLAFLLVASNIEAQNFEPTESDSIITMEVNFKLDSYYMEKSVKKRLDSLIDEVPLGIIQAIEIYGHTDSLADIAYNRKLSRRRVESILKYLILLGLEPLKVKTDYYGELRPKYKNAPETRHLNRRVELVIHINTDLIPPAKREFKDNRFHTGDKLRLPSLTFVGNQPIPNWESFGVLEQLLEVMYMYPDMKIRLDGHVCCADYYELSVHRARAVYEFLKSNGIDEDRMSYKGFSNSKPLFKEKTEADRELNRRVEVLVIKNTGRKVDFKLPNVQREIQVPVLSIKFPKNSSRLTPAGDFMLSLISDMVKESEGLFYEFLIYNNISDNQMTIRRSNTIGRALQDMGVDRTTFNVRVQEPPPYMKFSANQNAMMVKISER